MRKVYWKKFVFQTDTKEKKNFIGLMKTLKILNMVNFIKETDFWTNRTHNKTVAIKTSKHNLYNYSKTAI